MKFQYNYAGGSKPIVFRNKKELEQAIDKYIEPRLLAIRDEETKKICDRFKYIISICLYDEFQFGAKRINKFMQKFNTQIECINDDYVTLDDYKKECADRKIFFVEE